MALPRFGRSTRRTTCGMAATPFTCGFRRILIALVVACAVFVLSPGFALAGNGGGGNGNGGANGNGNGNGNGNNGGNGNGGGNGYRRQPQREPHRGTRRSRRPPSPP